MNLDNLIEFLIKFGPLILFLLTLLIEFLVGLARGLRKSRIFLIHSCIALTICIIVYYSFVNNTKTDGFLLNIINLFGGSKTFLQDRLNVSSELNTLSSVLLAYLPNQMNFNDSMKLLLSDNAAYLYTLVDLLYHIAFLILVLVLYYLLLIIMWIIYLIFYSDFRYKRRNKYEIYANYTDRTYQKRHLRGGLVGLFRGFVKGTITLSLIGCVFYSITGGTDSKQLKKVSSSNEGVSTFFRYYDYVEQYGNEGVYGVLNSMTDSEGTPYYLVIPDLFLQGNLNDEENDIQQKVYLRKELAGYVNLAKKVYNLIIKYEPNYIEDMLNSRQVNTSEMLVTLMRNDAFNQEFKQIIRDLDFNSYTINFAFNLITSAINNIEDITFTKDLNPQIKDILQILFKKGYYSDSIYAEKYEKTLDRAREDLPYIKVSDILTKDDLCAAYDFTCKLLQNNQEQTENNDSNNTTRFIKDVLDLVSNLTILNTQKKEKMAPMLGRIYEYAASVYLDDQESPTYIHIEAYKEKLTSIDWVDEIKYLIESSDAILSLYDNVYTKTENAQSNILNVFFNVFDPTFEHYDETNVKNYDLLIENLGNSKLLNEVLQTKYVYKALKEGLTKVSPTFEMVDNIKYANTYNDNNELVEVGEISKLLKAVKKICTTTALKDSIKSLMDGQEVDMLEVVKENYSSLCEKDSNNMSTLDYLIDSDLIESLLSALLIDNSDNSSLYIPRTVLIIDTNGSRKNIIAKDELKVLFNNFNRIIDLVDKTKGENTKFNDIINDLSYDSLFDSKIVQATVGKLIIDAMGKNDDLIIPQNLKTPDGWVSSANQQGEMRTLIDIFRNTQLDVDALFSSEENSTDDLIDKLMDENYFDLMLESNIVYYSASNKIDGLKFDDFEIIVPTSIYIELYNDTLDHIISKSEIKGIFSLVKDLGLDNMDTLTDRDLLRNFVSNREKINKSSILKASMANYILNSDFSYVLDIPVSLSKNPGKDGSKDKLKTFDKYNLWNDELNNLLISLDELFDLKNNTDFELTDQYFDDTFDKYIDGDLLEPSRYDVNRDVIDVCYDSSIVSYTLTKNIDKYFPTSLLHSDNIRTYAKYNGIYSLIEVRALLNAGKKLDVKVKDLDDYDFVDNLNDFIEPVPNEFPRKTKLEYVKESILLSGVLSEEIDDIISANNNLTKNEQAYEDYLDIYKLSELKALIQVLNGVRFSTSFDIKSLNFEELKDIIFTQTEDGLVTNSYLLSSWISYNLNTVSNVVIPRDVYDDKADSKRTTYVAKSSEIYNLLNGLIALNMTTINDIHINSSIEFTNESRDIVSKSAIIRASIAGLLNVTMNGERLDLRFENKQSQYGYLSTNLISQERSIVLLTENEFKNLITSMLLLSSNGVGHTDMSISMTTIFNLYENNKLEDFIQSSIIHCVVSEIINRYDFTTTPTNNFVTINMKTLQIEPYDLYTREEILNKVNYYRSLSI